MVLMPSWSSRFLSHPFQSAQQHHPSTRPSPYDDVVSNDQVPLSHVVPVMIPPPGNGNRRRTHTRSLSQPFPSFLASGMKKERKLSHQEFLQSSDDDSDDDGVHIPALQAAASSRKRSIPAEDTVTGKCMACNSTVRWPRNHKVYRCMVCLTVSDLEPHPRVGPDVVPDKNDAPAPLPKDGPSKSSLPATPLSIEKTRALIDQCLSSFLQARLNGRRAPQSTTVRRAHSPGGPRQNGDSGRSAGPQALLSPTNLPDRRFPAAGPSMERKDGRMRLRSASDTPPLRRDRSPEARGSARQANGHRGNGHEEYTESRPSLFRPLEEYIIMSFTGCECLNRSFMTPGPPRRTVSESLTTQRRESPQQTTTQEASGFDVLDPKLLLLGDIAENSSWWTGGRPRRHDLKDASLDERVVVPTKTRMSTKSPRIDWAEVFEWYRLVIHAGEAWRSMLTTMVDDKPVMACDMASLEKEIAEARAHIRRTLLKATEDLLTRPRRPLQRPDDIRFLLILLANPLLYPSALQQTESIDCTTGRTEVPNFSRLRNGRKERLKPGGLGRHSGIIKRILGLLGNLPNDCHQYLVGWFSRYPESEFERLVDLVGSFITYRLTRQRGNRRSESFEPTGGLVPSLSGTIESSPAQLHAALNARPQQKKGEDDGRGIVYSEDWQVRAAARVMSLLFAANNANADRRRSGRKSGHGAVLPVSRFYNSLLDYSDLVADFEVWEARDGRFSFCQYPFLLSISAKSRILEHEARRQMALKAREAFFDSILNHKSVSQYLHLKVRRECLIEDSLRGVSEVVGAGQEEIKKGLRIEFVGEEGVDAGGLRKEWFLLLVREVFDPNHGLFVYDEDSHLCYFNPFCLESSEQFFLVGVLFGLAIYNSTILDVALPSFTFKKLLAGAPPPSAPSSSPHAIPRPQQHYYVSSLDDLAEYRPMLAKGLRALLEYEGDVEETFNTNFVAVVSRYGENLTVPLCPGGETRAVTNANRQEFVQLYVTYLLDTAVQRQFEPFKRGFFTVCGGSALSLFRPEEIELMVRGSQADEGVDVEALRAVAVYENWGDNHESSRGKEKEKEPDDDTVRWFWDIFAAAPATQQRRLLSFITGSDRIPATGASSLVIQIACLGNDEGRFPIAHTCFNKLSLFRYRTREALEKKIWRAVEESEGFGLR